jgi:ActR/RegA family two-component response regulator
MATPGRSASAIDAMRAGAHDYVTKPLDVVDVALALDRAVKDRGMRT